MAELWAAGDSLRNIGDAMSEEFGTIITRNSVAGYAHRMGLPKRPSPIKKAVDGKPKRIRRNKVMVKPEFIGDNMPISYTGFEVPFPPAEPPVISAPLPALTPYVIAQDEATRCKYLMGDKDARRASAGEPGYYPSWAEVPRCQSERLEGKPYCHEHDRLCHDGVPEEYKESFIRHFGGKK